MTLIPEDVLRRFAAGTASREENRRVVRHLLARCEPCGAAIRSYLRPQSAEEPDGDLIARAIRRVGL